MGGNLNVTLITPKGETYKMERWTNPLPGFVKNLKFINKDESHIEEYLDSWRMMKKDFEENGPNGPFEHNMTNVYFPCEGTVPSEYGMVLIDMVKNKIYSIQGYTDFTRIDKINRNPKEFEESWVEKNTFWDELEKENRVKNIMKSRDELFFYGEADLSPFEVITLNTSADNFEKMMNIIDKEYGLSEKELSLWKKYIKEKREDY